MHDSEMWEAKYRALTSSVCTEQYVLNAELVVRTAASVASSTGLPFDDCFSSMMCVVSRYEGSGTFEMLAGLSCRRTRRLFVVLCIITTLSLVALWLAMSSGIGR